MIICDIEILVFAGFTFRVARRNSFRLQETFLEKLRAGLRFVSVLLVLFMESLAPHHHGAAAFWFVAVQPENLPDNALPVSVEQVREWLELALTAFMVMTIEVVTIDIAAATDVTAKSLF